MKTPLPPSNHRNPPPPSHPLRPRLDRNSTMPKRDREEGEVSHHHKRAAEVWHPRSYGRDRSRASPSRVKRTQGDASRDRSLHSSRRRQEDDSPPRLNRPTREDVSPQRGFRSRVKAVLQHPPSERRSAHRRSYAEVTRGSPDGDEAHRARSRSSSPAQDRIKEREELEGEWVLVKSRKASKQSKSRSGSEHSRGDGRANCHKCARPGHSISKCTGDWFCYTCRRSGHISINCPKRATTSNPKTPIRGASLVSEGSKTQESVAGERRVTQVSITPTPLMADFERRFQGGILIKAQSGMPNASDIMELLHAAVFTEPKPTWVIQEIAPSMFYAHCSEAAVAKEAIRVKGIEGRDASGLEFFITLKWWSREYGVLKPECLPPVWIRLYNLPFHCWVRSGFQNVVRHFGMLIDVDRQTATHSARKFARLKVGVAVKSDIPSKLIVEFDNYFYEVTVIVEAQKNVSFRDLAFGSERILGGGDLLLEEGDEAEPSVGRDITIPVGSNSAGSERFDRARVSKASEFQNLHPVSNFNSKQTFVPNDHIEPFIAPTGFSWQRVKSSEAIEAPKVDYGHIGDGKVCSEGKHLFEGTGGSLEAKRGGILKSRNVVGHGAVNMLGLKDANWPNLTREDIEGSVKAAIEALIQSRGGFGPQPTGPGPEREVQTAEASPVGVIMEITNKHQSTPTDQQQKGDRAIISSDHESVGELIGALDGIREDNFISETETDYDDKGTRCSVGSSSNKKITEYQRKGKRQMGTSVSIEQVKDVIPHEGKKAPVTDSKVTGIQEASKKRRIIEGE